MTKAAFVALILLGPCLAQSTSVEGRVTNAAGEPLKNATVYLLQGQPSGLTFETGADGSFVFQDVAPGRYNIQVQRGGYVSEPGLTVTVVAGQPMTGIALKMTRAALLVGRVLDPDGDPVPNADVKVQVDDLGDTESAVSRADGSFVIGGLKAGAYYLRATERPEPSPNGREMSGPKEAFVPTYYPGAIDESKATRVPVEAGAEVRNLDIHMRKARVFRVSGKVVRTDTGAPVGNAGVRMTDDDAGTNRSQITPDGTFEFLRVPPGKYTVSEYETAQSEPNVVGHVAVAISNDDVEGVLLKVGPGAEISGHIRIQGPGALSGMNVDLRPDSRRRWQDSRNNRGNGVVAGDGSFAFHGIDPDVYTVTIRNQPAGTYIKSMRFGDADVTGKDLDFLSLTHGELAVKSLDILLSPHAAEVTGTVRDAQGVARPGVHVCLLRAGDIVGWDQTDQNGAFHLDKLAPGDYRIGAWVAYPRDISPSDQGVAIKLAEDSREKIDPPLIPMHPAP
jgi:Carboxypeptidase regulatory-like domain